MKENDRKNFNQCHKVTTHTRNQRSLGTSEVVWSPNHQEKKRESH